MSELRLRPSSLLQRCEVLVVHAYARERRDQGAQVSKFVTSKPSAYPSSLQIT